MPEKDYCRRSPNYQVEKNRKYEISDDDFENFFVTRRMFFWNSLLECANKTDAIS